MANRTPLFNRVQPGGVFTISDVVNHPGDIWWVHSGTGTNGAGYGQNPDAPVATIDYAVGLATASKGDVIYVMPGHNETIINNTAFAMDKAGISVIGLGRGQNRPVLDFDNTAGSIIVSAANCRLSNLVFNPSVASCVLAIDVNAHDFELDNCHFLWGETTGDEFISMVDITAFDRAYIHDNVFDTEVAAGASVNAINLIDTEDVRIENNIFRGTWSGAVIFGVTTLSKRLLIKDNIIYNSDVSSQNAIDPGALNTTGIVVGNTITSLYPSPLTKCVVASHLTWHHNSFANTIAERGAMTVPTTSSV